MEKRNILIIFGILLGFAIINLVSSNNFAYNYLTSSETETSGGNITNFTELLDTPSSYSGEGGNCVAVNVGETGLEFISCGGAGSGDIESVFGDIWITNGSATGDVNLVFNITELDRFVNNSIDDRAITTETDPIFLNENSSLWLEALNKYNATYDSHVQDNETFNQSLTDSLYSSIVWGYNMTTPFTDWLSTFVYNYNQTSPAIDYADSLVTLYNDTWSSTYNETYDSLISFNNTNLAYLNETQNFTVPQNFNDNITQGSVATYWNGTCQITEHLVSGTRDIIC